MQKDDICESVIENEIVDEYSNDENLVILAEFFKVYCDVTRLKIIQILAKKEICVHEIAKILNVSQSAVSHQLKFLRQQNLVSVQKRGKHVFYNLNDNLLMDILQLGEKQIEGK